jgi:hypothetical protein
MLILQQFRSDNFTPLVCFLDLAMQISWSTLQDTGPENMLHVEDDVNALNIDLMTQVC